MVRVGLKKDEMTCRELTLLVVPLICGPVRGLSREDLEDNYPRLVELDLADDRRESCCTQPMLLVGLDYYWSFLTGETIQ